MSEKYRYQKQAKIVNIGQPCNTKVSPNERAIASRRLFLLACVENQKATRHTSKQIHARNDVQRSSTTLSSHCFHSFYIQKKELTMARWFRSEPMEYISLIVNEDAAHDCLADLGNLGVIQFTDVSQEERHDR